MALAVTPTTPGVYIDEENAFPEAQKEDLHEVPMEDPDPVPIPHVGGPLENNPTVIMEGDPSSEYRLQSDVEESSEEEN